MSIILRKLNSKCPGEGAADKQCQGEGKLLSQYVITNREKGKGKPPRLFPKTGYPLGYPEPALQQKTEERTTHIEYWAP